MARVPEEPLEALGGLKRLSATELKFMRFIWAQEGEVSSEEIYGHFCQARGTKSTILFKISDKGYVKRRQAGRHHYYTAKVPEIKYEQALLRQQLKQTFGDNSFEHLIAAFCGKKELTEKQLEKVRNLLRELEEE